MSGRKFLGISRSRYYKLLRFNVDDEEMTVDHDGASNEAGWVEDASGSGVCDTINEVDDLNDDLAIACGNIANNSESEEFVEVNDLLDNISIYSSDTQSSHEESEDEFESMTMNDEDLMDDVMVNENDELTSDLANLVVASRSTENFVDRLLSILQKWHPHLPKCRKTLVGTPRERIIPRPLPPGEFLYFGLEKTLVQFPYDSFLKDVECVNVDFGVDGLPLSRSSKLNIWPILASFPDFPDISPIMIAAFAGPSKPNDVNDFLREFVDEMNGLIERGYVCVTERKIRKLFNIRVFVCDAPAKAFVLDIQGHGGGSGCPGCDQKGKKEHKKAMVYQVESGRQRTNDKFRNRQDPAHHHAVNSSGLERIHSLDVVKQVAIDPMHACDLGVTKKVFVKVLGGESFKVNAAKKREMNNFYVSLGNFLTDDFNRKPRSFDELSNFKASEFRTLNRYTGFLFAQHFFSPTQKHHFMHFFCAMRVLSSDLLSEERLQFAQNSLQEFVRNFSKFYGEHSVSHNVHVLLHLTDYVRLYGNLNNFAAYKFENFLQEIKKSIKKPNKILVQLAHRIAEERFVSSIQVSSSDKQEFSKRKLLKEKYFGCGFCYKSGAFGKFKFCVNGRDNFCLIDGNVPAEIVCFVTRDGETFVILRRYENPQPFFDFPIHSMDVGIFLVCDVNEEIECMQLSRITDKCIRLPFNSSHVIVSILHSI